MMPGVVIKQKGVLKNAFCVFNTPFCIETMTNEGKRFIFE